VKRIAYRAETAMVGILREALSRADDARALVRDLFCQEADLLPDRGSGELRVRVHAFSNPRSNRAIGHLLEHLNAAELMYPGTTLKLTYSLAGAAPMAKPGPQNSSLHVGCVDSGSQNGAVLLVVQRHLGDSMSRNCPPRDTLN
jgi:hypothetical protein